MCLKKVTVWDCQHENVEYNFCDTARSEAGNGPPRPCNRVTDAPAASGSGHCPVAQCAYEIKRPIWQCCACGWGPNMTGNCSRPAQHPSQPMPVCSHSCCMRCMGLMGKTGFSYPSFQHENPSRLIGRANLDHTQLSFPKMRTGWAPTWPSARRSPYRRGRRRSLAASRSSTGNVPWGTPGASTFPRQRNPAPGCPGFRVLTTRNIPSMRTPLLLAMQTVLEVQGVGLATLLLPGLYRPLRLVR